MRHIPRLNRYFTTAAAAIATAGLAWYLWPDPIENIQLRANQEDRDLKGAPFNPSTQSVNRYASVLEDLTRVRSIDLSSQGTRLNLQLQDASAAKTVQFQNIDFYQIVPVLPYAIKNRSVDDFDRANLMLAEFARNGLSFAYYTEHKTLGYFNDLPKPFFKQNSGEDFEVKDGKIVPQSLTRPKRFNLINNCLKAGLWEVAAFDGAGEMYHAWFKMPSQKYAEMIRRANNFDASDREVISALQYRRDLSSVAADLDRLRGLGAAIYKGKARVLASKEIGGYSTQESRQKAQQRYYQVSRGLTLAGDVKPVDARRFSDLALGDLFSTRKFIAPGIYSAEERKTIPFDPAWEDVEIHTVTPRTAYRDGPALDSNESFIEVSLFSKDRQQRFVVGNVPTSLLVEQEDYLLPSFGVGLAPPLELAERRHLRMAIGPPPHYAYQLIDRNGRWHLENNHEGGVEQIALRVVVRGERTFLRITLIAYERILDLLELEVEITGELATELRARSSAYKPPLYRVYDDANII